MTAARLIHLNGAPGVGKSTLAAQYAAEHPGVLNCDVDRLRVLVGGWADDFAGVGTLVQPIALAMIRAHLDGGHDVVMPQMLASEERRALFRAAAVDGGHDYVHVLLRASPGTAAGRFETRPPDPLHDVIRAVVDADGGPEALAGWESRLETAAAASDVVRLDADGDVASTYRALLAALRAD
ncbi:MAG: hypothetical protein CMH83_11545 [Nocardioides sp.]|nr:hypothetical protein [Nocardioides sp.]